ncbi:hypothetical protein JTF08_09210 [Micrococcaceae bacterium RIT802]|nr:hypothetical protein [Micrococcaceae bacterium RIT 802]
MDNTPAAPTTASQKDAQSIRDGFYSEIDQITREAGGKWTYLDGKPFSPDDRDWFSPKECRGAAHGERQLLLLLLSGRSNDGPAEIKRMRTVLEDRGMKVTGYIPGKTPSEASTIYAEGPTGQFVAYGTNNERTSVRFGSECSAHPTMLQRVD